jgi:hypothetical protein
MTDDLTSKKKPKGRKLTPAANRSRRLFLAGSVTAGALVLFGGASWVYRSRDDLIAFVIRRHLPDNDLSEGLIRTFAADFLANNERIQRNAMAVHGLRVVGPMVFSSSFQEIIPEKLASHLKKFERYVVSDFLLSTDFFQRGARSWRGVTYQGLYDPYLHPCANPLARFHRDS